MQLLRLNVKNMHAGKVLTRKPPASPRLQSEGKKEDGIRLSKRSCESPKPGSRLRSASTGRDKKSGELCSS